MAVSVKKPQPVPLAVTFATSGMGGIIAWAIIHPVNTLAIRMNLASSSGGQAGQGFLKFAREVVRKDGFATLYKGLGAGLLRQVFYATSRLGLFEVFRDQLARYRETDLASRFVCGVASGGECRSGGCCMDACNQLTPSPHRALQALLLP
jgi:solute carrier family 25 oxoglutarate transporter 11